MVKNNAKEIKVENFWKIKKGIVVLNVDIDWLDMNQENSKIFNTKDGIEVKNWIPVINGKKVNETVVV